MNMAATEQHAKDWEQLAIDAERVAQYEEGAGRFGGVYRNKAQTYLRAAQSLRLEGSTGSPHCVCCLSPFKFHGVR